MRLYILFFLNILLFPSISLSSEKKIILGLDWFINPDHAPIVIADKYGYFNDENALQRLGFLDNVTYKDPKRKVGSQF